MRYRIIIIVLILSAILLVSGCIEETKDILTKSKQLIDKQFATPSPTPTHTPMITPTPIQTP